MTNEKYLKEPASEKQIVWLKKIKMFKENKLYTKGEAVKIITSFVSQDVFKSLKHECNG